LAVKGKKGHGAVRSGSAKDRRTSKPASRSPKKKVPVTKPTKKTVRKTGKKSGLARLRQMLRESEERFSHTFEHAGVCMAHASLDGRFIKVNRTFCELLGYEPEELLGRRFHDITYPDDLAEDVSELSRLVAGEINSFFMEKRYLKKDGSMVWASLTVALVRKPSGEPSYFIAVIQDITPRKLAEERIMRALREKEVLLKEVHHRVKNNMQIICSLQQLQARKLKSPEASEAMDELHGRIRSMALIHERLYESADFSHVNVAEYLHTLVQNISYSYGAADIEIAVDVDRLAIEMDCLIPVGLIVNELVTNSIKHAYKEGNKERISEGNVVVSLKRAGEGRLCLGVSDDGCGMPADFESSGGLGFMIVRALSDQLEGALSISRGPGTRILIEFPEPRLMPKA
jgi:PAS domain S-box-containing protein